MINGNFDFDKSQILKELENILAQLSIDLKFGRGYFEGGLFRYKDQAVIYLNRAHSTDRHIDIIAKELKQYDLESLDIHPKILGYLARFDEN